MRNNSIKNYLLNELSTIQQEFTASAENKKGADNAVRINLGISVAMNLISETL